MSNQDIQYQLTELYQELHLAENDLFCFTVPSMDSGEENWVRDQERYIEALKAQISLLTTQL